MKNLQPSKIVTGVALALTLAVPTLLPATAQAQSWRHESRRDRRDDHRQSTKNTWRNLGIAGGALGVAGLLTGNRTLATLGLAGGAYSAYRYEGDRRNQSRFDHDRYEPLRRPAYGYGGDHYDRHERWRDGRREVVIIHRR